MEMGIDPELLKLMRTWRRTAPPAERFRAGDRRAPTYDLECGIDHVVSSVSALADDYRDGKPYDYRERAAARVADLDALEPMIESSGDAAEQRRYREWLAVTRLLLVRIGG
jgi:hypothetical protein